MNITALDVFSKGPPNQAEGVQYSLLKLGHAPSIHRYGDRLVQRLQSDLVALKTQAEDRVLVYPGTGRHAVPNAISHVVKRTAATLGLSFVALDKQDLYHKDYAAASTEERQHGREIHLAQSDFSKVRDKQIILVDDGITSGTAMKKSWAALTRHGTVAKCYVLADFRAASHPDFERTMNRFALRMLGTDTFVSLLNSENNYTTSKLIHYLHEDAKVIESVLNRLSPVGTTNLILATLVYFRERAAEKCSLLLGHARKSSFPNVGRLSQKLGELIKGLQAEEIEALTKIENLAKLLASQTTFRLGEDTARDALKSLSTEAAKSVGFA